MKYQKFDDIAAKQIGFYVYALRDPRDGTVFYIGKGQRNRWFEHINEAHGKSTDAHLKLDKIREIESAGQKVDAFIIRFGIPTEKMAYEIEAAVIHAYRLLLKGSRQSAVNLTNIAEVHYPERGLVDVQVAQTLFNAPPAPEITVPCAMFRIPQLWYPEMSDEELKEATSGWWPASRVRKHIDGARYAFAVHDRIIRGVYSIDPSVWRERREGDRDWEDDIGKKPRWGFPDCTVATDMDHYLNTSVKHLFKQGDANAVRFFNC